MRFLIHSVIIACLSSTGIAFAANGDRGGDLYLSHGDQGFKGQAQWGKAGLKVDFTFETDHGHRSPVTLIVNSATQEVFLLLHDSRQIIEGQWKGEGQPSPIDLIVPGLGAMNTESIGSVKMGGIACNVYQGKSNSDLHIWYPQTDPVTPRLVRFEQANQHYELGLQDVRPANLDETSLKLPEGYTVLPVGLDPLLELSHGGQLGAESLVWMATSNLYREVKTRQYEVYASVD